MIGRSDVARAAIVPLMALVLAVLLIVVSSNTVVYDDGSFAMFGGVLEGCITEGCSRTYFSDIDGYVIPAYDDIEVYEDGSWRAGDGLYSGCIRGALCDQDSSVEKCQRAFMRLLAVHAEGGKGNTIVIQGDDVTVYDNSGLLLATGHFEEACYVRP